MHFFITKQIITNSNTSDSQWLFLYFFFLSLSFFLFFVVIQFYSFLFNPASIATKQHVWCHKYKPQNEPFAADLFNNRKRNAILLINYAFNILPFI